VPPGAPFVLSLRRDVDRALSDRELDAGLEWERAAGVPATWFFKPETYREEAARRLVQAGDDLGWHVCHAEAGDFGFGQRLREAYPSAALGTTFHGGQDSSYWRGRATLEHIARARYDYSERLTEWLPHPELDAATGLALVPIGLKVESQPDSVPAHEALIRRYRGHLVIENHPDLFGNELAGRIEAWKAEGAVVRGIAEHVRAVRGALEASCRVSMENGRRVLRFDGPAPSGVEVTLARGAPARVEAGGAALEPALEGELARYAFGGAESAAF
jgi:hypothetical protein